MKKLYRMSYDRENNRVHIWDVDLIHETKLYYIIRGYNTRLRIPKDEIGVLSGLGFGAYMLENDEVKYREIVVKHIVSEIEDIKHEKENKIKYYDAEILNLKHIIDEISEPLYLYTGEGEN